MFPDASVAPKDRPDGAATDPVPLSDTAAKANHQFFTICIHTKKQQNSFPKQVTESATTYMSADLCQ